MPELQIHDCKEGIWRQSQYQSGKAMTANFESDSRVNIGVSKL
ncbi:hypothetical protein [Butyrivibrio sp. AE3003]|nr:hypothetical protein [Butyrivibrio sp. AE3003]